MKAYTFSCRRLGLLVSASLLLNGGSGTWRFAPTLGLHAVSSRRNPMRVVKYWILLSDHFGDEISVERLILKYERWFLKGKARLLIS
jgi:hypothetical protein